MTEGRDRHAAPVAGLDAVLSDAGYVYASTTPVDDQDPGRFNALFGRDSLITALQLIPVRPDVARATLRRHATLQGRREDPETEEEPGRIVHEHWPEAPEWLGERWPIRDGAISYYGSADSTCWFLIVLAALGDADLADELRPAREAAGEWLSRSLERGQGLVRHSPSPVRPVLLQQGWRDAIDPAATGEGSGIVRLDGTNPDPPLADADTQATAVAALRALEALDDDARWEQRRRELCDRIATTFDPETMAIEAGDRRVSGAGSQLGWLLWAGALSAAPARAAAQRLCEPDVLTDYGVRTLSSEHPCFGASAYHRGGVWPFDSWLSWGGLRAHGDEAAAERVRTGVLTALDRLGGAPELYAVGDAGVERVSLANQVQAWTVGARWALAQRWDGRAGWSAR